MSTTSSETVKMRVSANHGRGTQQWRIEETKVFKNDQLHVDLSDVTGGIWDQLQGRGNVTSHLVLHTTGKKAKLVCASRGVSADQRQFYKLCAIILSRLGAARPEARIHMGGGRGTLVMKAVFAFIAIVAGLVLMADFSGLTGLTSPPENNPLLVIVGLGLFAFGVVWGWMNRPWDSDRMAVPAANAAAALLANV